MTNSLTFWLFVGRLCIAAVFIAGALVLLRECARGLGI